MIWNSVLFFLLAGAVAGGQPKQLQPPQSMPATQAADSNEVAQLRADISRLKVLLNQMRSNLAFVQTSQTPLKHQFEIEADAWQVVIDQMDRRLRRMEGQNKQSEQNK
jgi:hypothetical protein